MSLNESIVEDAALEWFGEQSRVAPTLIPAFSQGEKEKDGEVVLVGRLREAIRRLNPAIPSRTPATLRDTLLPKLLSGELSVAGIESKREAVT
jgi:type I restriction enzyme R subunit